MKKYHWMAACLETELLENSMLDKVHQISVSPD